MQKLTIGGLFKRITGKIFAAPERETSVNITEKDGVTVLIDGKPAISLSPAEISQICDSVCSGKTKKY